MVATYSVLAAINERYMHQKTVTGVENVENPLASCQELGSQP